MEETYWVCLPAGSRFQGVRIDGPGPFFIFLMAMSVGTVGGPDLSAISISPFFHEFWHCQKILFYFRVLKYFEKF